MSADVTQQQSSARVAELAIWFGRVEPLPLAGGITNQNFRVEDRGRRYVVRVGSDIPVHGVCARTSLPQAARRIWQAWPPAWCTQSRASWCSISSRDAPSRRRTCAIRQISSAWSTWCGGVTATFRNSCADQAPCSGCSTSCATTRIRCAKGAAATLPPSPDLLARAARLEAAVGPIDVVFGHNDLLAANFIDDGKRLWLVDWEYAGFNSPLFDLGGLASNSEFSPEQAKRRLSLYFDRPVDDELRRRAAAMTAASLLRETMWSMVSEIHSTVDFDYAAYTAENLRRFEAAYASFLDHGPRMSELPSSAKIVIIGGGIVGCSVAYHLGKMGLTDVLLLERGKLTSGSTWHAAGLVGQLRTSANITQLLGYSVALYDTLEQETGLATGLEAQRRLAARLQCRALDRGEAAGDHRHVVRARNAAAQPEGGAGSVAADADRRCRRRRVPADRRPGLAVRYHHVARQGRAHGGVTIAEGVTVTGIEVEDGRVRAVVTDQGRIACDKLVICAGQWSREIGRMAGVNIPLVSVQHQYLITETDRRRDVEPADAARSGPPHLLEGGGRRAGDGRLRAQSQALGNRGLPERFEFQLLENDLDHFEPLLELAAGPRAGHADGRHQAVHQRAGKLHARRQLHPRRSAGGARRLCRRRLQRLRHRSRAAAPAWRSPNGSPRASRLTICGRSTSAASARTISIRTGCARARSRPTPSTTRWPGRSRNIAPAARCAVRRSTTG